ncbi:hypothetical protein BT93_H2881 [Corymbia citriodora subsp. variegata]|nr:hypothetical protein BT93_H2881 [Corymbia citriodora subsp. variegata]
MGSILAEKEVAFVAKSRADADSSRRDDNFSSSESESPRPFMLRRSPPSGRRTPEFRSPAVSPRPHDPKDKDNHEAMSLKKFEAREAGVAEEEEEKEQCSPVSVLDRPFEEEEEDDRQTNGDYYDGDEDDYAFDYESSYALVQRTKQQLLQKLYRFERLAELDPVELEKRMLEQISDEEDGPEEVMSEDHDDDFEPVNIEKSGDSFDQSLIRPSLHALRNVRVPSEMRRLIINEDEQGKQVYVVGSWKGVDFSTIDMMVDQDFVRDEADGLWKRSNNKNRVGDTTVEIELAIFGSLVQELTEELSCGLGSKF